MDERGMRFSPHKNSSKKYCSVLGCKSVAAKDPTLRFHVVPKAGKVQVEITNKLNNKEKIDVRKVWMKRLKISESYQKPFVCSLHFTAKDYCLTYGQPPKRWLHKTAVPSVNLPTDTPDILQKKEKNLIRDARTETRAVKRKLYLEQKIDKCKTVRTNINNTIDTCIDSIHDIHATTVQEESDKTCNLVQVLSVSEPKTFQDQCVQVHFEIYSDLIKNEKDLNAMTGLSSFDYLDFLESVVKEVLPNMETSLCQNSAQLSIKDRIVLTFIKLKQNVSYTVISVLFKVYCEATCRKIFLKMIEVLAVGLQFAIHWPSKDEILRNLPNCFKGFESVRAIIDGIEISIQKPKKICCLVEAYSMYKSTYTMKFVTAVSPGGIITFVSKAYPGRCSDKAIFEKSKLIHKLDRDDSLMTNKGFLIDDICLLHGIQLIRPPFLSDKKQFSKEEALLNAKIAKARVHIERSNQRLKTFKILSTRLPSYLVSRVDQIFTIICAIVNVGAPIEGTFC